jgi:hypothetical protein
MVALRRTRIGIRVAHLVIMRRTPSSASSDTATRASRAALILADAPRDIQPHDDNSFVRFEGMDLVEWAATAARRAGIGRIHIVGTAPADANMLRRLRARGISVTAAEHDGQPFRTAPTNDTVVLLPAYTIVEPAVITALLGRASKAPGYGALLVDDRVEARHRSLTIEDGRVRSVTGDGTAASLDVMTLSWASVDVVRRARTVADAADRLLRISMLQAIPSGAHFAARLHDVSELEALERRYESHVRGARLQRFTAGVIERLSMPLSQLRAQYHF